MVLLPLLSQEKVTEKVTIDWWVLPLFAVDKGGDSVLDLTGSDIDLRVNNQKVTDFTLYKRAFSVDAVTARAEEKEPQAQETPAEAPLSHMISPRMWKPISCIIWMI